MDRQIKLLFFNFLSFCNRITRVKVTFDEKKRFALWIEFYRLLILNIPR